MSNVTKELEHARGEPSGKKFCINSFIYQAIGCFCNPGLKEILISISDSFLDKSFFVSSRSLNVFE